MTAPSTQASGLQPSKNEFRLNYGELRRDSRLKGIDLSSAGSLINSKDSFNGICHEIISAWKRSAPMDQWKAPSFNGFLSEIAQGGDHIIPTSWGGVAIRIHEHPHVEKYLVVKSGTYLAFEKHELKQETLHVKEGAGILLYRPGKDSEAIAVRALLPGDEIYLAPGIEHCVIGCQDLLIYEVSEDHKGMDKDLIFIYMPN